MKYLYWCLEKKLMIEMKIILKTCKMLNLHKFCSFKLVFQSLFFKMPYLTRVHLSFSCLTLYWSSWLSTANLLLNIDFSQLQSQVWLRYSPLCLANKHFYLSIFSLILLLFTIHWTTNLLLHLFSLPLTSLFVI